MGVGRRPETYIGNGQDAPTQKPPQPQRNLAKYNKLGSVIFGCTNVTYNECIRNLLFGLPYMHHKYVEYIVPGMPIFLFNYTERRMHGIYEAICQGALDINPYAFTSGTDGTKTTPFRAQIRVQLRRDFEGAVTLIEDSFKPILKESYYQGSCFYFEVDKSQTQKLIRCFEKEAFTVRRLTLSKHVPSAGQAVKQWKQVSSSTGTDLDEAFKAKNQPPRTSLADYLKVPKYNPSSPSELIVPEGASQQQRPVWREEDSVSDHSSRTLKINSEEELLPSARSEMADQESGFHTKSAVYKPKLNGTEPSTSNSYMLAQNEETKRVYEKLRRLTNGRNDVQGAHLPPPQISDVKNGDLLMNNRITKSLGWENVAQDTSNFQETAFASDEWDRNSSTGVSELEPTIAINLNKNFENNNLAFPQSRQAEIDSRRPVDGTTLPSDNLERRFAALERSHALLADEVRWLKREVNFLRRQVGYADIPEVFDYKQETLDPGVKKLDAAHARTPHNIYLLGGLGDQLSKLESVMVWTPSTDQLRTVAPMLSPRCCAAASVLGEHIYVFGGGDGATWYDSVERYDARADQWLSCAPMKSKRGSLGGVAVGDCLFAVGGGNGQVSFSDVESYDPYIGSWYPCAPMSEKRFCVAATEVGGALYAVGGFDGDQYLMSMERFDPRERLWSRLPPMSVKRGSLSAAVLNGKIYALGGYDGDGILDVVEIFDVRAGRWEVGPQMCCQRAYGAVGVIGEDLYYMGGLAEDEAVDSANGYKERFKGNQEDEDDLDGEDRCRLLVPPEVVILS